MYNCKGCGKQKIIYGDLKKELCIKCDEIRRIKED